MQLEQLEQLELLGHRVHTAILLLPGKIEAGGIGVAAAFWL